MLVCLVYLFSCFGLVFCFRWRLNFVLLVFACCVVCWRWWLLCRIMFWFFVTCFIVFIVFRLYCLLVCDLLSDECLVRLNVGCLFGFLFGGSWCWWFAWFDVCLLFGLGYLPVDCFGCFCVFLCLGFRLGCCVWLWKFAYNCVVWGWYKT